jgi:release factor glutamine methyltransferase
MESLFAFIRRQLESEYSIPEIKSIAAMICSDALNISTVDLHAGKYTDLSAEKAQKLQDIILRLLKHEPIQYIIGSTHFCGLKLKTASGVLIPRPETEELVQLIVQESVAEPTILDIGTGSGCIAIALHQMIKTSSVTAWDISEDALHIARANNNEQHANVSFEQQDVLHINNNMFNNLFDIIVSNPPYVAESEKDEMQQEVLNYEPSIALFVNDNDPLLFYRHIAEFATHALKENGRLYFEINRRFGKEIKELLAHLQFKHIRLLKDQFGNDRIITAQK